MGPVRNETQKNFFIKSGQKPDLPRTRRPHPLWVVPTPPRPLSLPHCASWRIRAKKGQLSLSLPDRTDTPCRPFFIQLFHAIIISHIGVASSRIFIKALPSLAVQGFEGSRTASFRAPLLHVCRPIQPRTVRLYPCLCAPYTAHLPA